MLKQKIAHLRKVILPLCSFNQIQSQFWMNSATDLFNTVKNNRATALFRTYAKPLLPKNCNRGSFGAICHTRIMEKRFLKIWVEINL